MLAKNVADFLGCVEGKLKRPGAANHRDFCDLNIHLPEMSEAVLWCSRRSFC